MSVLVFDDDIILNRYVLKISLYVVGFRLNGVVMSWNLV